MVRCGADQPAEALLQANRGVRKHVRGERVSTPSLDRFGACRGDGLRGHPERQLGDDDATQRSTRDIDTLPERIRSQQDSPAGLDERLDEPWPGRFPVYEDGPAPVEPRRP